MKHKTWTDVDENDGIEYEYRAQVTQESGNTDGWKIGMLRDMWVEPACDSTFVSGKVYRRPVAPKHAIVRHPDGYDVRVQWKDERVSDRSEWQYYHTSRKGWEDCAMVGSSVLMEGHQYRRKQEATA